jgi:hypothetical protein
VYVSEAALRGGLDPSDVPLVLQGLSSAQSTGDSGPLLQIPGVSREMLGVFAQAGVHAVTDAWRLIFFVSIIYSVGVICLSVLNPSVEHLLTGGVSSRLGPRTRNGQNEQDV